MQSTISSKLFRSLLLEFLWESLLKNHRAGRNLVFLSGNHAEAWAHGGGGVAYIYIYIYMTAPGFYSFWMRVFCCCVCVARSLFAAGAGVHSFLCMRGRVLCVAAGARREERFVLAI